MSIKNWPGGFVQPIPPTPAGPFQDSAAKGIWTLDQVAYWQKQGLWPTAGRIAFGNVTTYSTATGNSYETFVVPDGVTVLLIKVWGAGGGVSNTETSSNQMYGGGGGYAQCDVAVTPGESLRIYVGQPGSSCSGSYYSPGASGGGYSGVFRSTTPLAIAGAGGGGSVFGFGGAGETWFAGNGGAETGGNGQTKNQSVYTFTGGRGGTQSAGGASVCTTYSSSTWSCSVAGSSLQGGAGGSRGSTGALAGGAPGGGNSGGYTTSGSQRNAGGGGGGGGYYGGSGGSGSTPDITNAALAAPGGGGSCYVTGTNTTMLQGEYYPSIVNSSDPNYVSPCGRGGYSTGSGDPTAEAQRGLVVVSYSS